MVRERIEKLLDAGSFVELDRYVEHACDKFGMGSKRIPGVLAGPATIEMVVGVTEQTIRTIVDNADGREPTPGDRGE